MFQRRELEELSLQKERLVFKSEANRERLLSNLQRLQSPELWLDEVKAFTKRHPWWIITLATAVGTLAAKTLRHPRAAMNNIGRLGAIASWAFSAWKLFGRKR